MSRKPIDWENLEIDYRGGKFITKAAIAEHYGCSPTAINKKSEKHGWGEYKPCSEVLPKVLPKDQTKPHEKVLGKIATRKIEEIKSELGKHYSSVDEPLIVMLAWSYEKWVEQTVKMQKQDGDIILESSKTGSMYLNPRFNAVMMLIKNMITISNQLGFSISSRKRLGIIFGKEDGNRTGSLLDVADTINEMEVDV